MARPSLFPERITQQQLESYLWGAATLLRGYIDAGDYKQYIFPLLFFKRISDIYDEEYQQALAESGGDVDYASFAENHRFQLPAGAHWADVRGQATNVGQALQSALRLPVDREVVALEARLLAGLPAEVAARGAQHLDLEARLLRRQDVGVDVARVDELTTGEQAAFSQLLVHRGESRGGRPRRRCRRASWRHGQ